MAKGRQKIDLPTTSAKTRALLGQLHAHRQDVVAKKRQVDDRRDRNRKLRIGARLVRFGRRGDSAAKQLLTQIFDELRDGDRTLFAGWDLYPPPPPPVPITDRHLPRTLQEIDAEIQRTEAHLKRCLAKEKEADTSHHARRMTILGGALLGLVEAGSAEAAAMLDTILQKIPTKERAPFKDWEPPTLPAAAAQSAQQAPPSQDDGPDRSSSSASPPDARRRHEESPPTSNAG